MILGPSRELLLIRRRWLIGCLEHGMKLGHSRMITIYQRELREVDSSLSLLPPLPDDTPSVD